MAASGWAESAAGPALDSESRHVVDAERREVDRRNALDPGQGRHRVAQALPEVQGAARPWRSGNRGAISRRTRRARSGTPDRLGASGPSSRPAARLPPRAPERPPLDPPARCHGDVPWPPPGAIRAVRIDLQGLVGFRPRGSQGWREAKEQSSQETRDDEEQQQHASVHARRSRWQLLHANDQDRRVRDGRQALEQAQAREGQQPTQSAAEGRLATSSPPETAEAPRHRLAPRAIRRAISLRRAAPRTTARFAKFRHTTRNTSPTHPNKASSAGRRGPETAPRSGWSRTPQPAFASGYCWDNRRAMTSMAACACGRPVSGLRRAKGARYWFPRWLCRSPLGQRRPHFGGVSEGTVEPGGHDPDDRIALPIERDRLSKRLGRAAEAPPPKPVAEDHNRLVRLPSGVEDAPDLWRDAQHAKEAVGDPPPADLLRLALAGQREGSVHRRGHLLKHGVLLAPVLEVKIRGSLRDQAALGVGPCRSARVGEGWGTAMAGAPRSGSRRRSWCWRRCPGRGSTRPRR